MAARHGRSCIARWRSRRSRSAARFPAQIIEEAFGCKAYNTYGCREFMLVAWVRAQDGLHVNADHR
jgi:phenylacetate-CoA ligase